MRWRFLPKDANPVNQIGGIPRHQLDFLPLAQFSVNDANKHNDPEIGVIPAIDEKRLQRLLPLAFGGRQACDNGFEDVFDALTGFGRNLHRITGIQADHILDLGADAVRLGCGQIDLVQHRYNLVIIVERLIDIGERLGLDPLAGVDDEERTFAGGQ